MPFRLETETPEYFFLRFLDAVVDEFDNLSTAGAEQVIVVGVVVGVLVAARTLVLAGVAGKPCFGEQLERPEDCGLSYAGIDLPRSIEYVFGAQVPFGRDKGLKDNFARFGHFEVFRSQIAFEQESFFEHSGSP
jgi:hypothetical protein